MPLEFSPTWDQLELRLPINLRTTGLRVDWMEVLKKIRSVKCSRCALDIGDSPHHSHCAQEDRGSGTWKCKRCFDRHISSCDWMLSKSCLTEYMYVLIYSISECQQYGLGSRPFVQRRTTHVKATTTPPSEAHTSPSIDRPGHAASTTRRSTRASVRNLSTSPEGESRVERPHLPTPPSFVQGSSSNARSTHANTPGPESDWLSPIHDLLKQLEDSQRQTTRLMNAVLQELQEIKGALPGGEAAHAGHQADKGKGKRKAN